MQSLCQLELPVCWLSLLLEVWVCQQSLIHLRDLFGLMFLNRIEKVTKLVKLPILSRLVRIVEHEGRRGIVEYILFISFTCFLNAVKQLVLIRKTLVPVEVIHDAALTALAQEVKVDLGAERAPLEIENCRCVLDLLPPLPRFHHAFDQLVVVAAEQDVSVRLRVSVLVRVSAQGCVFAPNFFFLTD